MHILYPFFPRATSHKDKCTQFQKKILWSILTLVVISNYSQMYVRTSQITVDIIHIYRWVEFSISPKFSSAYVFVYSIITLVPPPTHAHIHVSYTQPCVCTSEYMDVVPFPDPIPSYSMLYMCLYYYRGMWAGRTGVCEY